MLVPGAQGSVSPGPLSLRKPPPASVSPVPVGEGLGPGVPGSLAGADGEAAPAGGQERTFETHCALAARGPPAPALRPRPGARAAPRAGNSCGCQLGGGRGPASRQGSCLLPYFGRPTAAKSVAVATREELRPGRGSGWSLLGPPATSGWRRPCPRPSLLWACSAGKGRRWGRPHARGRPWRWRPPGRPALQQTPGGGPGPGSPSSPPGRPGQGTWGPDLRPSGQEPVSLRECPRGRPQGRSQRGQLSARGCLVLGRVCHRRAGATGGPPDSVSSLRTGTERRGPGGAGRRTPKGPPGPAHGTFSRVFAGLPGASSRGARRASEALGGCPVPRPQGAAP